MNTLGNTSLRLILAAGATVSGVAALALACFHLPRGAVPVVLFGGVVAALVFALQLLNGGATESAGTIGAVGAAMVLLSLSSEADVWVLVGVSTLLLAAAELASLSCAFARLDPSMRVDIDGRLAGAALLVAAGAVAGVIAASGARADVAGGFVLVAAGAAAAMTVARLVGDRPRL